MRGSWNAGRLSNVVGVGGWLWQRDDAWRMVAGTYDVLPWLHLLGVVFEWSILVGRHMIDACRRHCFLQQRAQFSSQSDTANDMCSE
jgi:hypothetical protein